MNCRECREWLDDLLLYDPGDLPPAEIARHLEDCPACTSRHAMALETLGTITPRRVAVASPRLKERILAAIPAGDPVLATTVSADTRPRPARPWRRRAVRTRMVIALAVAAVLAMILFPIGVGLLPSPKGGAADLLSQAAAAETRLFAADDVVSLTGEIIAEPVADRELAVGRWLPIISVGVDGKTHYHQLTLGGEPGTTYKVRDEAWYDPATHRFAHVLSLGDRPLFANSFDGRAIHSMELDDQGRPRIKVEPVAPGFQPPRDTAEILGLTAVARPASARDKIAPPYMVREEGPVKLADGSKAHVLRITFVELDSSIGFDAFSRLTIRDDDRTIESLEFFTSGKKLYTIRRGRPEVRREPRYGWDLAGIRPAAEKHQGDTKLPVRTLADMIKFDVTVDAMAKGADYPVYVLDRDPDWSVRRQIVDILDVATPPHRMFATVYPARDRRHVVLIQAQTFNINGEPLVHEGKLVYTSPGGIKVWSTKEDKMIAKVLLSSMGSTKAVFTDKPSADCTGYVLETPEKTYPVLAVNGVLTDAELHGLADRLVRVKSK